MSEVMDSEAFGMARCGPHAWISVNGAAQPFRGKKRPPGTISRMLMRRRRASHHLCGDRQWMQQSKSATLRREGRHGKITEVDGRRARRQIGVHKVSFNNPYKLDRLDRCV